MVELFITNPLARYTLCILALELRNKALRFLDVDNIAVLEYSVAVKQELLREDAE